MQGIEEHPLDIAQRRRARTRHFRPVALVLVPIAAILFQVYFRVFFGFLAFLDLPLLVTVYFALMRREPVFGLLTGGAIGLVQDSLSHNPLGMFGIVKTLVGYFGASVGQRFDIDNSAIRFLLSLFFFFFHEFFFWVLSNMVLAQHLGFDFGQALVSGVLNAAIAIPLFRLLDKL